MILPEAADFPCRETGTVRRSADAAPKAEVAAASPNGRRDPGDAPDYPHNGPTSTGWLSRHRGIVGATALIALVLAAYWPLLHAPFTSGSTFWVVNNSFLHQWSGLGSIWRGISGSADQYYPLTYTAFLLQYQLWGATALGYHIVELLLQAINAILLWLVLKQLGLKSAWVVAAVFAIHPVQVETLGSILEQRNLLSGTFCFAAALAWIRFAGIAPVATKKSLGGSTRCGDSPVADSRSVPHHHLSISRPDNPENTRRGGRCFAHLSWYLLATVFYSLGLLAKTDICTLPVVLLLLGWWKRWRWDWRTVFAAAVWLGIGAIMAAITIHVEHSGSVGARGREFEFTGLQRLLIAGRNLWFYPLKLLWPWPLLGRYPRWHVHTLGGWQWLYVITACAVPITLLSLQRKIGRGPFTAVAIYGITIAPVLGFISFEYQFYSFVADHFQYLACIGWIALVVESLRRILGAVLNSWRFSFTTASIVFPAVLLTTLVVLTRHQSQLYRPPVRVWMHVLRYYPDCPTALAQVGVYECQQGRIAAGEVLLKRAFRCSKGADPIIDSNLGDMDYRIRQRYASAATYYRLALRHDPLMLFAIARLTQCYEQLGQWPRAFATLRRGLSEFPHSVSLHLALANALAMRGDYRAAAFQYRLIVQAEPHNAKALYNLAVTLQKLGKTPAALATYQQVLRWAPRWARAYFMYGQCLLAHGQPLAAAGQFRQAIAFAPAYPPIYRAAAYQALARALAAAGQAHQAAAALARAAQLQDHKRISSERPVVKMPR